MKIILIILLFSLVYGSPIRNETSELDAKNKRLTVNNAPGNQIGSIENFKVVAGGPGAVGEIFKPIGSFLSDTLSDIFDRPIAPFFQNQQKVPSGGSSVSVIPMQAEAPTQNVQQNAPSQSASNTNVNQNSVSVNSHVSPLSPLSPSIMQSNINNFQTNAESDGTQASNTNVNSVQDETQTNSNPSIAQSNLNVQANGANSPQGVSVSQSQPRPQNSNSQSNSHVDLQSSNPFGDNFPFNNNFNPTIINGNIDSIQLSQLNSKPFPFGNNFNPTIINSF